MAVFGVRKFNVGFGEVHMEQDLETGVLHSGIVWDDNVNHRVTYKVVRGPVDDRLYIHASSVTEPLFVFSIGSKIYSYNPEDLTINCRVARDPKATVSKIVFVISNATTGREVDTVVLEYADDEPDSWFFGERKTERDVSAEQDVVIPNPTWVVDGNIVSTTFGEYTLNIRIDKKTNFVISRTVTDNEDHVTDHICKVGEHNGIDMFFITAPNGKLVALIPAAGSCVLVSDVEPEEKKAETPRTREKPKTTINTMFTFADTTPDGNIVAKGVVNRTYSDFTYDVIPVNCIQAGEVKHVDIGSEYFIDAPEWTLSDKGFKTQFNNLSLEVAVSKVTGELSGWFVRDEEGEVLDYSCKTAIYDGKHVIVVEDDDCNLEALITYEPIRFFLKHYL